MSITILRVTQPTKVTAGQNGWNEVSGLAQFDTTTLTGELPCPFGVVQELETQVLGGGTITGGVASPAILGSVSATLSGTLISPIAGNIAAVLFVGATAISTNDTNYWSFGVVNKTQTLTAIDGTDAANTTKATGGAALAAYTARSLKLSGTAANLVVAANDVLEFTITKTASATTIAEATIVLVVNSGTQERVVIDEADNEADGVIQRSSTGYLAVRREGPTVTNNLIFSFRIRGY